MKARDMQDCLLGHGIKPSVQRLAVMEYLKTHCTHPTEVGRASVNRGILPEKKSCKCGRRHIIKSLIILSFILF